MLDSPVCVVDVERDRLQDTPPAGISLICRVRVKFPRWAQKMESPKMARWLGTRCNRKCLHFEPHPDETPPFGYMGTKHTPSAEHFEPHDSETPFGNGTKPSVC